MISFGKNFGIVFRRCFVLRNNWIMVLLGRVFAGQDRTKGAAIYLICCVLLGTSTSSAMPGDFGRTTKASKHAYSPFEEVERAQRESEQPAPPSINDAILIKLKEPRLSAQSVQTVSPTESDFAEKHGLQNLKRIFPDSGKVKALGFKEQAPNPLARWYRANVPADQSRDEVLKALLQDATV